MSGVQQYRLRRFGILVRRRMRSFLQLPECSDHDNNDLHGMSRSVQRLCPCRWETLVCGCQLGRLYHLLSAWERLHGNLQLEN